MKTKQFCFSLYQPNRPIKIENQEKEIPMSALTGFGELKLIKIQ